MTQDALENKREQLEELDKSEREARRLEAALSRGKVNGASAISPSSSHGGGEDGEDEERSRAQEEEEGPEEPSSAYLPPHPGPNPARRRAKAPGMGLLNALSYTLHGMMDVDPETARRNSITKTKETISQVHSFFPSLHLFG